MVQIGQLLLEIRLQIGKNHFFIYDEVDDWGKGKKSS